MCRRLVVGEDLVDAEGDVGELYKSVWTEISAAQLTYQQGALDRIAPTAHDPPASQENGACNGRAYEYRINVANFRKGGDAPEEVYG